MEMKRKSSALGLKRIPLEVDFAEDKKIRLLVAECGLVGFAVVIKLLCKIYSEGYFTEWTEVERILFASDNKLELEELNRVIRSATKWGLFSGDALSLYEVLTSEDIQEYYFESTKRRQFLELVGDYLLVDPWKFRTEENTRLVYVSEVWGGSPKMQNSDFANSGNVSADKNEILQNSDFANNGNDFADESTKLQKLNFANRIEVDADKNEKLQNGVFGEDEKDDLEESTDLQNCGNCIQNSNSAEVGEYSVTKSDLESEKVLAVDEQKKKKEKKEKSPFLPPLSFPPITPLSYPPYNPPQKKEKKKEKEEEVADAKTTAENGGEGYEEMKRIWNRMAKANDLPTVMLISKSRKEKIKARVSEWRAALPEMTPEEVLELITREILKVPFLKGDNDRGWRVDFDFVFRNDTNWQKILEGKYLNAQPVESYATDNSMNSEADYDACLDVRAIFERADEEEREALSQTRVANGDEIRRMLAE